MINPELEMRPIARRGYTAEELELRRYAASEMRGSIWCLFANGSKCKKEDREEGVAKGLILRRLPSITLHRAEAEDAPSAQPALQIPRDAAPVRRQPLYP